MDAEAFEEAASEARSSRNPSAFRVALALYTGELLPGDRHEAWARDRREELRRVYLALLVEVAGLYEEREELGPAIEALGLAVAQEPTNEGRTRPSCASMPSPDRPERALAQYERLHDALSGDNQPRATTPARRDSIGEAWSGDRLPLLERPPHGGHNLPVPRTSFVGRKRELPEVKRLLNEARLLTLTGAGGSGKTRLALEVARGVVRAYPGGVWLVRLAPLSEPEMVTQAVAETLEVPEQPGRPLLRDAL